MLILGIRSKTGYDSYRGAYVYSRYPNVFIKDGSVNVESLQDSMKPVFDALSNIGYKYLITFIITSGNDGSHSKGSYHYDNRAVDISFRCGGTGVSIPNWGDGGYVFREIKKVLNPNLPDSKSFDVVLEKDHVHIEYDPSEKVVVAAETKTSGVSDSKQESNPQKELVKYIHNNPTVTSFLDLPNSVYSVFGQYKDKINDLANVKGDDGKTNRERVEATYINLENGEETEKWPLLKMGTVLYVDADYLTRSFMSLGSEGQVKPFNDYLPYFTKTQTYLNEALANGEYVPEYGFESRKYIATNTLSYINSLYRVWIFSKALNKIFDVTDFVRSVQTQTNVRGGDSFSLSLFHIANIEHGYNETFSWLKKYKLSGNDDLYVSNPFADLSYFMKNVGENDIVFISYETLKLEKDRERFKVYGSTDTFEVPKNYLGGQYYDFIGLVSSVQESVNGQGSASVNISGASLEKLFIDDEAIFRPYAVIGDSFDGNLMIGDSQKRGWRQRIFADGTYQTFLTKESRTLGIIFKFILNMVSNVGFLPLEENGQENTSLFSSYKHIENGGLVDDRSYLYELKDGGVSQTLAKGIYQIVKLSLDPQLSERLISNTNMANPQGSLLSLMQGNCVSGLSEMVMDTYKNTFDIIVRIPPFTKEILDGYRDNVIEIDADSVANESLNWESDFYTWFELEPRGNVVNSSTDGALCFVPTVFLREFIDLWGSRRMSVVSSYGLFNVAQEIEQSVQDLCFLVKSNFYLPFTRKGSITLSIPDRRIRKGMWIKYKRTGEIFYVDSVSQSAGVGMGSVSRSTTISVSRGLVEKYVFDEEKGYFNIIDFDAMAENLKGLSKEKKSVSFKPAINRELFDFYVKRKQFE